MIKWIVIFLVAHVVASVYLYMSMALKWDSLKTTISRMGWDIEAVTPIRLDEVFYYFIPWFNLISYGSAVVIMEKMSITHYQPDIWLEAKFSIGPFVYQASYLSN